MVEQVVALVPMRHDSERVRGKNYRSFNGRPLFHYIIATLLKTKGISQVVIDTDSQTIRDDTKSEFPDVLVIERPEHLRDGMTPMNEVLANTVTVVEAPYYLQTHSTNPMLSSETIERGIKAFFGSAEHDSVFAVQRHQSRFYDAEGLPINHNPNELLRTQDLPPLFEDCSAFYIFERETLLRKRNRLGDCPLMFEVPRVEAADIDEELDFKIAEELMRLRD